MRAPSLFSITLACILPSMIATHEFVVPRSTPMTSPLPDDLRVPLSGRAIAEKRDEVGGSHCTLGGDAAGPESSPLWNSTVTSLEAENRFIGFEARQPGGAVKVAETAKGGDGHWGGGTGGVGKPWPGP